MLAAALGLALAGCASPTVTVPPNNLATDVVTQVAVGSSPVPATEPTDGAPTEILPTEETTPTPGLSNAASETPAVALATPTPSPVPGEGCTNNVKFVADVTVPDGTQFAAGQPVDKQWRVRNTGTCDWGPDYRLVLVSGNAMGAPTEVALFPAKAGSEAILELNMVAPTQPGPYTGRWQARSPSAKLFGDRVFVTIDVVPITATATITATP